MDPKRPVDELVQDIVTTIAKNSNAKELTLKSPIDFLCFGRAGVGKSTFYEALTNRPLGASAQLDHSTKELTCIIERDKYPTTDGRTVDVYLRFWDTKGLEKWNSGGDVDQLFADIRENNVNPVCVFYCTTANGRIDSGDIAKILKYWIDKSVPVFYLITNIYAMSDEQYDGQLSGAKEILNNITSEHLVPAVGQENVYLIKTLPVFVVGINSKEYIRRKTTYPVENIDTVMKLCLKTLPQDKILQFFLATVKNTGFWVDSGLATYFDNMRSWVRQYMFWWWWFR